MQEMPLHPLDTKTWEEVIYSLHIEAEDLPPTIKFLNKLFE